MHAPTVGRRLWQAEVAVEPEEFQFVGMRSREALIALAQEIRAHIWIRMTADSPKQADFTG
jgi:hypothetical protein